MQPFVIDASEILTLLGIVWSYFDKVNIDFGYFTMTMREIFVGGTVAGLTIDFLVSYLAAKHFRKDG